MAWKELEVDNRIQKIHCETPDDLLEYLRPSNQHWLADNLQISWIFRGHQREDWQLEPSATRKEVAYFDLFKYRVHHTMNYQSALNRVCLQIFGKEVHQNEPTITKLSFIMRQAIYEKMAIDEFIEAADDVGLLISDDHLSRDFQLPTEEFLIKLIFDGNLFLKYRRPSHDPLMYIYKPWYLESEVVALAQHHGIPTRLLDWTTNPWIAAYFAACEKKDVMKTKNIVVWALNLASLPLAGLRLFKPRRNRLGYLHAQDGVFIYDEMANYFYLQDGNWRTIETAIATLDDPSPAWGFTETEYWLRKITFPAELAQELLRRLISHKVERRFLMPTYDNVVKELHLRYGEEMQDENKRNEIIFGRQRNSDDSE